MSSKLLVWQMNSTEHVTIVTVQKVAEHRELQTSHLVLTKSQGKHQP